MYLGAPYTFNKTSLLLIKKNVCGNMLEAETYIQCQSNYYNNNGSREFGYQIQHTLSKYQRTVHLLEQNHQKIYIVTTQIDKMFRILPTHYVHASKFPDLESYVIKN